MRLTGYHILIVSVLLLWPFAIMALLFLMSRLENYVKRQEASSPAEAGLEPVTGSTPEKEVRIVLGEEVVGEPKH